MNKGNDLVNLIGLTNVASTFYRIANDSGNMWTCVIYASDTGTSPRRVTKRFSTSGMAATTRVDARPMSLPQIDNLICSTHTPLVMIHPTYNRIN